MIPTTEAWLSLAAALFALAVGGARPAARTLRSLASAISRARAPLAAAAAGLAALLWAAREVVPPAAYALGPVALGTASFAVWTAVALRYERACGACVRALERLPDAAIAGAVVVAALLAQQAVLEDLPHTSDEIAYQFQAKTLATGRTALAVDEPFGSFGFAHIRDQAGQWHGIMNPGWPALLALGELAGLRWLVNPLLAGATLLLLGAAFRRADLGNVNARLALLALAFSPFFVFQAASYLSHTSNLFLFALFVYAWARMLESQELRWALLAGAALAWQVPLRPLDSAVVAAPFAAALLWRARRERRWLVHLAAVGVLAGTGVAALLAYNADLTGDALVFPQEQHFERMSPPGQRFGFGFGADMGTRTHGEEWPGYYPGDAARVTGQRVLQLLVDLHALPWILLALFIGAARLGGTPAWWRLLLFSMLGLIAAYTAHFYHGIAFGARHYALALPALALALALPVSRALARGGEAAAVARAAIVGLLVHTLLVAWPERVREYGEDYRGASGALRSAVLEGGLHDALVFVPSSTWKSAFPLNDYPLSDNDVVFAHYRPDGLPDALARFPGRTPWLAAIERSGNVVLRPLGVAERALRGALSPAPDASGR